MGDGSLSSSCPFLEGHTALVFTPTLSAGRVDEWHIEPVLKRGPRVAFWQMETEVPLGVGRETELPESPLPLP